MADMSLRSSSPSLPLTQAPKLFPSENCTKKTTIWPRVLHYNGLPGRLRQKGVTFFRLQVHERGRDFTNWGQIWKDMENIVYLQLFKGILSSTTLWNGIFFGNRGSWCPKGLQVSSIQVPDCLARMFSRNLRLSVCSLFIWFSGFIL